MINNKVWHERYSGKKYYEDDGSFYMRTPYERDRARIIHNSSFRSLQHKTQLFNIEDSDKTHTRLTHTLEVSQISNGLLRVIKAKYDPEFRRYYDAESRLVENDYLKADVELRKLIQAYLPPDALMESICLTHDIGHAPFGHSGEYALCSLMYYSGGFEGNAQTFRVLTRLANYSREYGLDLTRRTLLGVIKYPFVFDEFPEKLTPEQLKQNDNIKIIKGIYKDDQDVFNWVLAPLSEADSQRFQEYVIKDNRPVTLHKSFDCSIMELADDIAYSVHDLEDAVNILEVEREDWEEFFANYHDPQVREIFAELVEKKYLQEDYVDRLFSKDIIVRRQIYSTLIDILTSHVMVRKKNIFSEPLLDLEAYLPEKISKVCKFLKELEYNIPILSQDIRGVNNRGKNMLAKCFTNIQSNPYILGRKKSLQYFALASQKQRNRFICDFLATMTNFELSDFYAKYI